MTKAKVAVHDEACHTNFTTVSDYREHSLTLTHKLETMRRDINNLISAFELEMWKAEPAPGATA